MTMISRYLDSLEALCPGTKLVSQTTLLLPKNCHFHFDDHLLMMMVIIHWWWWRVKQMDEPTIFLLTITMETGGEIYAQHSFTIVLGHHFTVQKCYWPTMVDWTRFEKEKYRSFIPQTMGWCNMYLGQPALAMLWESLATRNRLDWFWFPSIFHLATLLPEIAHSRHVELV